jgi:hypothetical protein
MVRTVGHGKHRTGGELNELESSMIESNGRAIRAGRICLLFALTSLTLACPALAATATLSARAIPIAGFPGTGNYLDAGFEAELEVTIAGTEYAGSPSPLTGLDVYAPAGVKVDPAYFASCAPSVLEAGGGAACPRGSRAGPQGVGEGVVSFGDERVPEQVAITAFFAPAGLTFYVVGNTPSSFEYLEPGRWTTASAPFGPELLVEVPLIETDPGGYDASVTSFKVKVGAARRQGKKTLSYLTSPSRCPRGGFPVKLELKFLSGQTVPVSDAVPCPKSSGRQARR